MSTSAYTVPPSGMDIDISRVTLSVNPLTNVDDSGIIYDGHFFQLEIQIQRMGYDASPIWFYDMLIDPIKDKADEFEIDVNNLHPLTFFQNAVVSTDFGGQPSMLTVSLSVPLDIISLLSQTTDYRFMVPGDQLTVMSGYTTTDGGQTKGLRNWVFTISEMPQFNLENPAFMSITIKALSVLANWQTIDAASGTVDGGSLQSRQLDKIYGAWPSKKKSGGMYATFAETIAQVLADRVSSQKNIDVRLFAPKDTILPLIDALNRPVGNGHTYIYTDSTQAEGGKFRVFTDGTSGYFKTQPWPGFSVPQDMPLSEVLHDIIVNMVITDTNGNTFSLGLGGVFDGIYTTSNDYIEFTHPKSYVWPENIVIPLEKPVSNDTRYISLLLVPIGSNVFDDPTKSGTTSSLFTFDAKNFDLGSATPVLPVSNVKLGDEIANEFAYFFSPAIVSNSPSLSDSIKQGAQNAYNQAAQQALQREGLGNAKSVNVQALGTGNGIVATYDTIPLQSVTFTTVYLPTIFMGSYIKIHNLALFSKTTNGKDVFYMISGITHSLLPSQQTEIKAFMLYSAQQIFGGGN